MKRKLLVGFIIGVSLCFGFSYEDNFIEKLQEKLFAHYEKNLPLKIHLFLNQPAYAPGDTAFFKVRLMSAGDLKPLGGFAIINVNLVDAESKIVHHQKIRIKDGQGTNQIAISPSLKPGVYTIVAYNNWMKNHDQSSFAFYEIRIEGEKKLSRGQQKIDFDFFVEGGSIIEGITNKIVFTGAPFDKVLVRSNTNTTFPEVKLNESGYGIFFLTPRKNTQYTASIGTNVRELRIEKDGIGIFTSISPSDTSARCILQVPEYSLYREQTIYLVWSAGRQIYYAATIDFRKRSQGVINIPKQNVPKGLSQITVFSSSELMLAQRLIHLPEKPIKVELTTDREVYDVREKVTVKLKGMGGKSVGCMTVYNKDLFDAEEINDYDRQSSQTLFNLPFNGLNIPKKITATHDFSQLNDFLITQNWSGFLWEDVLKDSIKNKFQFNQDIFLTGKVEYADGKSLPDSTYITFFLQSDLMIYQMGVSESGDFDFPLLLDFYGTDEIYYKVESRNTELKNVRVTISKDAINNPSINQFNFLPEANEYSLFSKNRRELSTAFTIQSPLLSRNRFDRNTFFEKEVSGVDATIQLRDYIQFQSMEEVLLEIIPYLRYQKREGSVKLWLDDNSSSAHDPLYMIDGVLTDDTDYFMNLLPKNVVSIKIIRNINKLNKFGSFGKNGIVLVETNIPDNYLNVRRSENVFSMEGLTKPKPCTAGLLKNLQERIPVLQSTVYFNPDLAIDEQGNATVSFHSADNTGKFRIYVQGFNEDGKLFSANYDFEVKFGNN